MKYRNFHSPCFLNSRGTLPSRVLREESGTLLHLLSCGQITAGEGRPPEVWDNVPVQHSKERHTRAHTHTQRHTNTHTHTNSAKQTNSTHTYTNTQLHTHMHGATYTHTHRRAPTHTRTHARTHTLSLSLSLPLWKQEVGAGCISVSL